MKEAVYLYTSVIETILFSFSFKIFLHQWGNFENEFILQFQDSLSSKTFLPTYRGAYQRNSVTDEVNEYFRETGIIRYLMNIACSILTLFVYLVFGLIFFGCRQMILDISSYQAISTYKFSLPHIAGYLVYFIIYAIFELFVMKYYL